MKKIIVRTLLIGCLTVLLTSILWKVNILDSFENITWDMRVRLFAQNETGTNSDKVVLIMLDQKSLDWAENEQMLPWPWPRQVLAPMIDFAKRGGAKSIAFDVVYTEPSTSGIYDDEVFKYSIEASNNFVGALTLSNEDINSWKDDLPEQDIKITGFNKWVNDRPDNFDDFTAISFPIPEVANSSKMLANVRSEPERDGIYRYGRMFYNFNGRIIPSFALASYLVGNNNSSNLTIKGDSLYIDDKKVPMDNLGRTILRYRKEGTFDRLRAATVIQSELQILEGLKPEIDPSVFKDAYVMFGYAATGLLDLRPTPISETTAGVEIHATMLDNLLKNDFISDIPGIISFIIAFVLSLIVAFLFTRFQGPIKGVIFFIVFGTVPVLVAVLTYNSGYWFQFVYIELSIILSLASAGVLNYATEGKQKRYIKHAFKQYLSPDFIENLLSSPDKLKLGGEKKELSIFFSDLEGFTTISEGLNPEELTSLLNEYLTAMTDIILEEGGTIDKYEGDAIIAFWNAPLDYEDHALRALRASLRCQDKLRELRPKFHEQTGYNLKMRIGLNTGYAVVGNLGSNTRFDYTMLGDSVNLAARLEGINKQFGTYTMISQSTYDKINNAYPVRELSKVAVVGKKEAITVYEPFLEEDFRSKGNIFESFKRGLDLFYNGDFINAIKEFEPIKDKDPASEKYINKCKELLKSDLKLWDGVWKMTQK